MAAPNIVNVSTIIGKTVVVDLTTASATQIVSNPAGSGKVLKINLINVANVDGAVAADITVSLYGGASLGGSVTQLVSTVSVPADATLIVMDRSASMYLEEDRSIGATAGVGNDLKVICSYEEIS